MPVAGLIFQYGSSSKRWPKVPGTVLTCAQRALSIFGLEQPKPVSDSDRLPRWLRLYGSLPSGKDSRGSVLLDSDEVFWGFLQSVGVRSLYANIRVSIETVAFVAPSTEALAEGDSELQIPIRILLEGIPQDLVEPLLNEALVDVIEAQDLPILPLRSAEGGSPDDSSPSNTTNTRVVMKKVRGLLGSELTSQAVEPGPTPSWNEQFKVRFNHRLTSFMFVVLAGKTKIGTASLPMDLVFDKLVARNAKRADGQVIEFDEWLPLQGDATAVGKLHVKLQVTLHIPYVLPKQTVNLPDRIQIGLSWDFEDGNEPLDFDASVVGLGAKHEVVGNVWHQKLVAFDGAMTHSGDDRKGEGEGDDETITVDTRRVPADVQRLVVCLNSYSGAPISKASFAFIRLITDGKTHGFFALTGNRIPESTGLLVGTLERGPEGWQFLATTMAAAGKTVEESLPEIICQGKKLMCW